MNHELLSIPQKESDAGDENLKAGSLNTDFTINLVTSLELCGVMLSKEMVFWFGVLFGFYFFFK